MTKRQKVAKKLNEIATECKGIAVELPENNVGLPIGTFSLDSFLEYVACAVTGDIKPY